MPDIPTSDLILTELRDLRTDFSENARVTGERLASLETSMHSLVGNGQPGRISLVESDLQNITDWKHGIVGWWSALCAIGSIVGSGAMWLVEHFHLFHLF